MSGEHLDILRVELDLREVAYIYLGEVILVKITGHHLVTLQDMLVFQLLLGAEHIPCSVDLLVLSIDHLALLAAFASQAI